MYSHKEVVFITGSSGMIGYPLAQRLAEEFHVVGFGRGKSPYPPSSVDFVCMDVSMKESVLRALDEARNHHGAHIASVIHLAGYDDFTGDTHPDYEAVNVRGTERLLRALQDFEVEQFIFASTMLVHAPCQPGQRIDENGPLEPKWVYPRSKRDTEEIIRAERGAIPIVLLRIPGVYDDRGHLPSLVHQIRRLYERWLLASVFPGDIGHGQAVVHLHDLLDVFVLLVQNRASLPRELPLLVGEAETPTYDELQRQLGLLIHDEQWDTHEVPKALAKAGAWLEDTVPLGEEPFIKPCLIDTADDHYALDTRRAHALLGWRTQRTWRATLPIIIAALKADPLAWYRESGLQPPAWLEEAGGGDRRRSTKPNTRPGEQRAG